MKKLAHRILLVSAVLAAPFASLNSAFSQTTAVPVFSTPLTNAVFPFTNLLGFTNSMAGGFTNTLVQPTNLSLLRLTNLVTILLNLQTNIEVTLPVLGVLTSNANVVLPSGTPQVPSTIVPITQAPAGVFQSSAGQVTNQQSAVITMTLGTNVIEVDPTTFQALVQLRDDLEQTLPVLQMLNGTAPSQTNTFTPAPINIPLTNSFTPATRGFGLTPLTGGFPPPLTNSSRVLSNPSPF